MMQPEIFQSSWSLHPGLCGSAVDAIFVDCHDVSSSFTSTKESSGVSFLSTIFSDEVDEFPTLENIMETRSLPAPRGEFEDLSGLYAEINKEGDASLEMIMQPDAGSPYASWKSSEISEFLPYFPGILQPDAESPCVSWTPGEIPWKILPGNDVDLDDDDQKSLYHLLGAYGEAKENGHIELEEVIEKRIQEKINPIGQPRERVAFHLFNSLENYLKEESSKNAEAAIKLFQQCFPYVRFAHFAANTAIIEAIPDGIEALQIIDFDIGQGAQWASLIDAISQKNVSLKLTSIKLEDGSKHAPRIFDGTMKRLYNHAKSSGVKLQIEQINLDELVVELKRMKKQCKKTDWFAFNCMIGLPQTGKRQQAREFLSAAKVFLAEYANHRGTLTLGDGEAEYNPGTRRGYSSFFERRFMHFEALFDSMESNFPVDLAEARITMESLFMAPSICSESWFQQWKNMHEWLDLREGNMLGEYKISVKSIIEAKEMVNEAKSSYSVIVEGERENEMVLEWKGTPLVRVSSWI